MEPSALPSNLRLGTSSFASEDWVGPFYPEGTRPDGFLEAYSRRLDAVEIDATFYRVPSARQVDGWRDRTPAGFVFAAKVPRSVTHGDVADEAEDDLARFLDVMRRLGPKLGPLLFQFPYVAKARDAEEYATGDRFRGRLAGLLEGLPEDLSFAVEVRNERWVHPLLLDLLRSRGAALALIDYYTTPGMPRIAASPDAVTASFAYMRFLGNHREMDALVEKKATAGGRRWDAVVRDRTREMRAWVPAIAALSRRVATAYAFFNNHYAGYAPGSIELFRAIWREVLPDGA
jgi:uncharacterized protein YecE (DUF72 family)